MTHNRLHGGTESAPSFVNCIR